MRSRSGELWFVAPVPRVAKRTRLAKFAEVYRRHGLSMSLVGWTRTPADEALPADDHVTADIRHSGGGYAVKGLGLHYAWWMVKASAALVRGRPAIVHALGVEAAVLVLPLMVIARDTKLVYDDADRFSLCHRLPKPVFAVVQIVERLVSRAATVHVVPGLDRYPDGVRCSKVAVLENVPSHEVVKRSEQIPARPFDGMQVLVTGWIGDTRGASIVDQMALHFESDDRIRFVAAGRTTGEAARRFVERANVDYRGEVGNAEALALCRDSDLVFTLYDPALVINRFAEPNKWGDCMVTGTPFVVNDEVETATRFLEAGAARSFPYADVEAGIRLLGCLLDNTAELEEMRVAIQAIGAASRPFEDRVEADVLTVIQSDEDARGRSQT